MSGRACHIVGPCLACDVLLPGLDDSCGRMSGRARHIAGPCLAYNDVLLCGLDDSCGRMSGRARHITGPCLAYYDVLLCGLDAWFFRTNSRKGSSYQGTLSGIWRFVAPTRRLRAFCALFAFSVSELSKRRHRRVSLPPCIVVSLMSSSFLALMLWLLNELKWMMHHLHIIRYEWSFCFW